MAAALLSWLNQFLSWVRRFEIQAMAGLLLLLSFGGDGFWVGVLVGLAEEVLGLVADVEDVLAVDDVFAVEDGFSVAVGLSVVDGFSVESVV